MSQRVHILSHRVTLKESAFAVQWLPGSTRCAFAGSLQGASSSMQGFLRVCTLQKGELYVGDTPQKGAVVSSASSPMQGVGYVECASALRCLAMLSSSPSSPSSETDRGITECARYAVSGGFDGVVRLWDLERLRSTLAFEPSQRSSSSSSSSSSSPPLLFSSSASSSVADTSPNLRLAVVLSSICGSTQTSSAESSSWWLALEDSSWSSFCVAVSSC